MNELFARLKQRRLVQWALAYLAAAWVTLQALSLAAASGDWPHAFTRMAFVVAPARNGYAFDLEA